MGLARRQRDGFGGRGAMHCNMAQFEMHDGAPPPPRTPPFAPPLPPPPPSGCERSRRASPRSARVAQPGEILLGLDFGGEGEGEGGDEG
eukprot:scaffold112334_cov18-Phaeocystis_antarctica.AAC.1